jgi:hypothetical protein
MRMTRLGALLAVAACAGKPAAPPSTPTGGAAGSPAGSDPAGAAGNADGAASDADGTARAPGAPAHVHPAVRSGKRTLLRKHAVPASVIVPAGFALTARDAGEGVYNVFLARTPLSIRISNTHGCIDAHELELAQRRGETSVHDETLAAGRVRLWQGKAYRIDACLASDSGGGGLHEAATCSAVAASREDAELAYAICRSLELVLD